MPTVQDILMTKGKDVQTVDPSATAMDAIRKMNQQQIGALLVVEGRKVTGIFTERDVLRRVVGQTRIARPDEGERGDDQRRDLYRAGDGSRQRLIDHEEQEDSASPDLRRRRRVAWDDQHRGRQCLSRVSPGNDDPFPAGIHLWARVGGATAPRNYSQSGYPHRSYTTSAPSPPVESSSICCSSCLTRSTRPGSCVKYRYTRRACGTSIAGCPTTVF